MYICICNAVTEREIRETARLGARSLRDLREELGVAGKCGRCKAAAAEILREERGGSARTPQLQPA
jgi:bacterioferritin-associated ferredoxin